MRRTLLLCTFLLAAMAAAGRPLPAEPAAAGGASYALLVGCTAYANLEPGLQLRGPANDVPLMEELLVGRFGFSKEHVVVLAERSGEQSVRPTRANIQREFERLAEIAQPRDRVVIFLAGHGSQQPDDDPDNPDDPEPDGLDEIFLPADVGSWNGQKGAVANAICDDELRAWLDAIRKRDALVWAIVDACHSGTMVRGAEEETVREVPPESLGIPDQAMEQARRRAQAAAARRQEPALDAMDAPTQGGGLVALYAAQSTEPTVEKLLPPKAEKRKPYGLLTYTLNQVLGQATRPITYRELVQRVDQQYAAWGRDFPTPAVEGTDVDREVLGLAVWKERSRIALSRNEGGAWSINAGAIQAITAGSVLAVYPPAGAQGDEQPLGHVKVLRTGVLESVVEPTVYGDSPRPNDFPPGCRCEPVYHDYGDLQLCVAATEEIPTDANAHAAYEQTVARLRDAAGKPDSLIQWADDAARADWIVRFEPGGVFLVPSSGWLLRPGNAGAGQSAHSSQRYGPAPPDENLVPWLSDRLERIARVRNLLSLSADNAAGDTAGRLDVHLEMLRLTGAASADPWEPVPWASGRTVSIGDRVVFRVENRGPEAVDATLLFLDCRMGIHPVMPRPGTVGDNRVEPGKSLRSGVARITEAAGEEHLLLIAVRSDLSMRQPIDFSALCQPGLEPAAGTRGGDPAAESPLGRLLARAVTARGPTRGMDEASLGHYAMRVLSWRVAPPNVGHVSNVP